MWPLRIAYGEPFGGCIYGCIYIPVTARVLPRVAVAAGHVPHKEALRLVCTHRPHTLSAALHRSPQSAERH